jgi:tetratricopeptide (TPR) repeat protein
MARGKSISGVRAWVEQIVIPTYERGPEDKNPPLLMDRRNPIHPGSSIIYPYPMQETLFNRKADRSWQAYCLENEYLRLAVLPELGGRLLYLYDKAAGEEAIYRNHVLKWARIGLRGAWVSGGIEWNFPNGHTVTSSSPVDCAIRENADGSATILLGEVERVSRMRWRVGLTLRPQRAFMETQMHLTNRTCFPGRFWFWANSAAPVSGGMEYLTSATKVMTLKDVMSFPVHEGVDIHWDRNHVEAQDMFCLNPRAEFVGWYNHDLGRGMINVADRTEARGTKFYTWGNSDDGNIWESRLTDADGPYAEMQSGRLATMGIWEILSPYSEESWREVWYPVRRIGPPSFANRDAALAITEVQGSVKLGVQVNSPRPGAKLLLEIEGKTVWEQSVDLEPASPFVTEIPITEVRFPAKGVSVTLRDSCGALVARHCRRGEGEPELEFKGYMKVKADRQEPRAEAQWCNGLDFEKLGDYAKASEAYRNALQDDPLFSPARVARALLALRRGLADKAEKDLAEVLSHEPGNDEARYGLGVCRLHQERREEAIEELRCLLRSPLHRLAAAYLLGGLYLGMTDASRAEEQLRKVLMEAPWHHEAAALLAATLRHQGRTDEARSLLDCVLAGDPLCLQAVAEAWIVERHSGGPGEAESAARSRLQRTFRGEVQSYLEVAAEYGRFALYIEASEILELYNRDVPKRRAAYPMVDYYLGYYAEKLGKNGGDHYQRAAAVDPSFVFPHRLESERVLRRVLQLRPADARARYYLGNLLCAKDRPEEALALWEEAARGLAGFSVVHRNIGRARWKAKEEPDAAIRAYEQALAADPGDYKLYFELNRIFLACGLEQRRQRLIESIPAALLENDVIAEMVAALHVDQARFEEGLQILTTAHFYPWEVYKGVRVLYVDANIGAGIAQMKRRAFLEAVESFSRVFEYPRNIGVGEPSTKANAEALYRLGLALEAAGEEAEARRHWQRAAEEPRLVPCDLSYYKARALQRLGENEEAVRVLRELVELARENITGNQPDTAGSLYLSGLGRKGLGETAQARQDFNIALALRRDHRRCRWQVSGFDPE